MRGRDGEIISRLFNFENALNEEYAVTNVSRGDRTSFVFNKNLHLKNYITVGDTIGYFTSMETNTRYAQLVGDLQEQKALLKSMEIGEKQSVINEAEQKLNYAKAKAERQRLLLTRLDSLYKNNLVSTEEFELAEAKMNQLQYEVNISRSQLEAVRTGVKPEEKQVIINRVDALQNELSIIENKLKSSIVKSPITGVVNKTYSPDTLFSVTDEAEFVLLMPINLDDTNCVKGRVSLSITNLPDNEFDSELEFLNQVQILNARQVRVATTIITDPDKRLISGMVVPCEIKGDNLLLKDHLIKMLD